MNYEQIQFVQAPLESEPYVLMGIPGGGKTTAIIAAVQSRKHKSQAESLILTFSRAAAESLRKREDSTPVGGRIGGSTRAIGQNNAMTIHALSGFILNKFKDEMNGTTQLSLLPEYALRIFELFPKEEIIRRASTKLKGVKYILVDEAQDLSQMQYNFVIKLGQLLQVPVSLVGDPNQSIYQFQGGSDKHLLNHPGTHIYLTTNYRSTRQIVEFANAMRPWRKALPKMQALPGKEGPKPLIFTGKVEEVMLDLLQQIEQIPFEEREATAILSPVRESKMNTDPTPIGGRVCDRYRNLGLSLALNVFKRYGIDVQANYRDGKDTDETNRKYHTRTGAVNLLTLHGSKGLQFKHVFVLNFHHTGFGITPSISDTQRFRYLFYVGMTRAEYTLRLYILENKIPFPDIHAVNTELYDTNQPLNKVAATYANVEAVRMIGVTDFLRLPEENYLPDKTRLQLEEKLGLEISTDVIYSTTDRGQKESHPMLRGLIAEELFKLEYYLQEKRLSTYIHTAKKPFLRAVVIPPELEYSFNKLARVYPVLYTGVDNTFFTENRDHIPAAGRKAYEYLYKMRRSHRFHVIVGGSEVRDLQAYQTAPLLLDKLLEETDNTKRIAIIVMVQLRRYQMQFERKDLLQDYELAAELTMHFEEKLPIIQAFVKDAPALKHFNRYIKHPHCKLVGEMDACTTDGKIIEMKYSGHKIPPYNYCLQALLYHTSCNPYWIADSTPDPTHRVSVELWNLRLGLKHNITVTGTIHSGVEFMYLMVSALNKKKVWLPLEQLKFVLDFETTGLDVDSNEIIERSVKELQTGWSLSNGLIRPSVPISTEITTITGISNAELQESADLNAHKFKAELQAFFAYAEDVTLIAHNGNRFDFPILNRYLKLSYTPEDSIYVLRRFLPRGHSGKLENIYKYFFGEHVQTHRAEADVDMIRKLYLHLFPKTC